MASFENQWCIIESTFNRVSSCTIAEYSFQTLYDTVYKLVRQNKGDVLFDRLSCLISSRVALAIDDVLSASLESILQILHDTWKFHILTISRTSEFLFFFNKHFCKPRNKPTITELGVALFRDQLLKQQSACHRVQDAFVERVKKHRIGENANLDLLFNAASVLQSINALHLVQQTYLEELNTSQTELAELSSTLQIDKFVAEYHTQCLRERNLCLSTLGERSLPSTESLMQDIWLLRHREKMVCQAQLKPFFVNNADVVLTEIYSTFEQVGEADSFIAVLKQHLADEVSACAADVAGIERILELERFKRRMQIMLMDSERYARRVEALAKAFQDAVDRLVGLPDALTAYLESRNTTSTTEEDFELAVDNVISLFKVISDKDLFEAAYKMYLAKRLLSSGLTQHEEDRERLFISKLKREIGCSFTSRIEGMFADRKSSDEINNDFREFMSLNPPLQYDLQVLVLTSGFWPQYQTSFPVIEALQAGARLFTSFFTQRHSTRRLEFCVHQGTCEVRVTSHARRFDVQMPATCTRVLTLFSGEEKISASAVGDRVNIPTTDAIRSLMGLSRQSHTNNGLLCCDSRGVSPSTNFWFNAEFRSKSTRFRISEISVKEKTKTDVARVKNDDDRKFKIDAAIVRIMKSRRTLSHASLVSEVQRVASQSFDALPDDIKRRIEHLLEREFIARNVDVAGWYVYVA